MAAVTPTNEAWLEKALVSIAKASGADVAFQGLIETVDVDMGEKDVENIALLNAGQISTFVPDTMTTITLEGYSIESGTDTGSTAKGFFDLQYGGLLSDTTQVVRLTSTYDRTRYRIAICWTDDTTMTNAASAPTVSYNTLRLAFANGFITSVKPSFTDKKLKFTITFKVAPRDKSANAQILVESTDGSAAMTALQSYTSTVKF